MAFQPGVQQGSVEQCLVDSGILASLPSSLMVSSKEGQCDGGKVEHGD